ncbi:MAG: 2-oxo acid dehydrogenase subunit E2 [Candidatus Marinimicrobia bacterium]|jgi:2-oxoglutarate dehydrogenase E2 component (dihydrolipoamide succinyltransferase)|nr:2-oxo acid dehydrogenase subunit E2 [Candidatus Neomarinimicrobiota bacterium]MBT3634392.1 2-oxo acid dehydrogenase subunit E2 [Candidatus Neomarinimicrobiota bacterium]MBT3681699.1 2-oxo acid dehydrogenase subunit E2 [Candidatus Neomarinimicrobiota bacterium]MBT3759425.1 2-oxo acid dehydrogenase subunit E2 [Candidatus Neomarinimicrobiota bacterium]MBT3895913.1 2-oxo acid dehydrogenase subunit E2 [Candidatus Neomarinimicrobiota bacterium]
MIDVVMPKLGESITEGTILEWKKKVGDTIELDENLLEISTDKVDSEVPSPAGGFVAELLYSINDVVEVGEVIARIASDKDDINIESENIEKSEIVKNEQDETLKTGQEQSEKIEYVEGVFLSPLVKSIAREKGISSEELSLITGSGKGNRITKKDILNYLENRISTETQTSKTETDKKQVIATDIPIQRSPLSESLEDNRMPMDRIRKKIAAHMLSSQRTSAHVYSTSEVDVTNLVDIRQKYKDRFKEKYNISLTYTPMIMDAVIKGIQEFPLINASVEGEDILNHRNINMGIAVALRDDNLIVPVVHNSEELNFLGMARQISQLASKARSNSLDPNDIFGSTFTITNPGIFGSLMGMAIINQPNVGILSVGAIQKRPVVKETEYGDVIAIRHMMYLTLGYDHRIIDGAYGTRFLTRLCEILESFNENQVQ